MSKKGENIYKRKDGRWEARYIKCYSADGKAKYGYCYGKTYFSVKEKVISEKASLINRTSQQKRIGRKRISSYCDEWLLLRRSKVKESTYVKYSNIFEKHIKPYFGAYYAETITSLHVEQFGYGLLHENGLSVKTVRDILSQFYSIVKFIRKQNPLVAPIDFVYPKSEKREMRVLTREEQANFVSFLSADTDPCKFGTLLALLTGLRIGEICALKWGDISLKDNLIKVSCTMQRLKDLSNNDNSSTKIVISEPKSYTSQRVIPLSPFAVELCRKHFINNSSAYILTGTSARYIEPRSLQYKMTRYAKQCNLPGVHFHSLRHSFATRCVEVGFDIKSLSEVLGHASPCITLERYVHSSIELKRENMNKLSAIGY